MVKKLDSSFPGQLYVKREIDCADIFYHAAASLNDLVGNDDDGILIGVYKLVGTEKLSLHLELTKVK